MMSRKRKAEDQNMNNHGKISATNHIHHVNGDEDYTGRPVHTWSVGEVASYLDMQGHQTASEMFSEHNISGKELLSLNENHLSKMGLSKVGDQLSVLNIIKDIHKIRLPYSFKVFNDSIHGHIELHPLCVKIIDTPEFQRLRFIKQLGACYFVFPGAAHNRFEHSLGVCHLAGQLIRTLKARQPELNITDQDVLCVEIAGLCHDLGHGPFSHLFDGKFIPEVQPEKDWQHETASVKMFDHLIKRNNQLEAFTEYGLSETDIKFIKEQIVGPPDGNTSCTEQKSVAHSTVKRKEWIYEGREQEKSFLYEIVSNKRNGIDVDKWDYFARDCHMLGIQNNFDHARFIKFARVLMANGERQICCRDKEVSNLYDMFHTRITLHRRAYQHRVCRIIENMIVEALVKANDVLKFPGKNGKLLRMSEAINDMEAYSLLTDDVFGQIQRSTEPELQESRDIIKKIVCRDLYKFLGQTRIKEDRAPGKLAINKKNIPNIKTSILKARITNSDGAEVTVTEDDIIIDLVCMNYGMKTDNPMDHVWFYEKRNPEEPVIVRKEEVSQMLPMKFNDQYLRLYCKKNCPAQLEILQKKFISWCEEEKTTIPRGGSFEMTPCKVGSPDANGTPYKASVQTSFSVASFHKAKQTLQF